ncbi:hypothetical protein SAY87_023355 [Trapa incisa]|uniref:Uncharacterized protein n=1 Tax=Trapa incisa TaxID=236973 RepID=A0AAN7K5L7_9MYRT|nr:hypothetical protein SAY87_023355 [Trapa incisa]
MLFLSWYANYESMYVDITLQLKLFLLPCPLLLLLVHLLSAATDDRSCPPTRLPPRARLPPPRQRLPLGRHCRPRLPPRDGFLPVVPPRPPPSPTRPPPLCCCRRSPLAPTRLHPRARLPPPCQRLPLGRHCRPRLPPRDGFLPVIPPRTVVPSSCSVMDGAKKVSLERGEPTCVILRENFRG